MISPVVNFYYVNSPSCQSRHKFFQNTLSDREKFQSQDSWAFLVCVPGAFALNHGLRVSSEGENAMTSKRYI